MRLVLLGPPGAGKGTQGQCLSAYYGVPHIATGALVRDHIARHTEFGRKVEAAIAAGNFAPDEDILYWVQRRLAEPDAAAGYVLDGFPRDLAQAQAWEREAPEDAVPLDAVIELTVPVAEIVSRVSGRWVCPIDDEIYHVVQRPPRVPGRCDRDGAALVRRPDDEPDAVRHRLEVYEALTLPLRDYYRERGLLVSVDGAGDAEEVTGRIVACLPGLNSLRGLDSLRGLKNAAVEV